MPATVSDTFYPILLSKKDQCVTKEELEAFFQRFAELADQALGRGERYVIIVLNDPSKDSAAERKKVAEVQGRYVTAVRNDATLAAYVPVDSALARGAYTAFRWVMPELVKHVYFVPNIAVALKSALAALEKNGTPFKGDLDALRSTIGL